MNDLDQAIADELNQKSLLHWGINDPMMDKYYARSAFEILGVAEERATEEDFRDRGRLFLFKQREKKKIGYGFIRTVKKIDGQILCGLRTTFTSPGEVETASPRTIRNGKFLYCGQSEMLPYFLDDDLFFEVIYSVETGSVVFGRIEVPLEEYQKSYEEGKHEKNIPIKLFGYESKNSSFFLNTETDLESDDFFPYSTRGIRMFRKLDKRFLFTGIILNNMELEDYTENRRSFILNSP